jgi:hypothetical protein
VKSTKFNHLFAEASHALKLFDGPPLDVEGKARLTRIGLHFALLFQKRDGGHTLDEMSKALNEWHQRKEKKRSKAAIIRDTIIALNGMFQPGRKRHAKIQHDIPNGKLLNGKMSLELEPWPPLTAQLVAENIEEGRKRGCHNLAAFDIDGETIIPSIRVEIQRQMQLLKVSRSKKGRPRTIKLQQKQ